MTSPSIETEVAARRTRPLPSSVLVGMAVAVGAAVVAGILLTIPLFALARFTEPSRGTGREWFSTGLQWAAGLGIVMGLVAGVVAGWWYRTGWTLPQPPDRGDTP